VRRLWPTGMAPLALALVLAGSALGETQVEQGSDEAAKAPSGRYLLMDPNGRAVTNLDFPGRFQLISFGYTYCPDICPTTLLQQAAILRTLGERAEAVQPIFITVDPRRDTSEVLQRYTSYFHPRIIGLTGSPELIQRSAEHFRVRYERVQEPGAPADAYHMDHTAGMYLLGPDGGYIRRFAYETSAAEIAERLAALVDEAGLAPAASAP
jgi:cytochrome oxidase Cu insertion factor (SCO1/SenC/PrrC family)